MQRRLLWHFFSTYYAALVLGVAAIGVVTALVMERDYRARLQSDLRSTALLLRDQIKDQGASPAPARLQQLCENFALRTGHRAAIVSATGAILADSHAPPERDGEAAEPVESPAVLTSLEQATSTGASRSQRRRVAVALPFGTNGNNSGVVHASMSSATVESGVNRLRMQIAGAGGAACLLGAVMVLAISRRVRRPLEAMRHGARRFARGDLDYKVDLPPSGEMSDLAGALNQMAHQLERRMGVMSRQASEQEAVLASMIEGVLAVDTAQRVISMNAAAAGLLGTLPAQAKGRGLQEVIRNTDLLLFVARALESDEPVEDDVVLRTEDERVLQARGTSLRNAQGSPIGAVVVLHDVTRVRKLETLRRDFVANVSHELKTPITSIKGFVETLLDGALGQPEDAQRFLRIIARQADRLNAIIEDLLSLAKIEQSVEAANVAMEPARVANVLRSAIDECAPQAAQRQNAVRLECDASLSANVNPPLLEQAIINLLDNAIKYSEPEGEIVVRGLSMPTEIVIQVQDHGCGIEPQHLDRLFERFYRVDKARSRKFGGTGLGLAIVKHIVHVHGGNVSVASAPGEGSTFSIHLPVA